MGRRNKGRIERGALVVSLVAGLLVAVSASAVSAGTDYRDAVLADNPVAYWRLGEAGGSTAFDETGALDATYVGSPMLGTSGLVIDTDDAVAFDGSNDHVDVPDSNLINIGVHTERTIELWFRANDVTSRQVIVEEGGTTRGLSMYLEGGTLYIAGWNTQDDSSPDTPWGTVLLTAPVATATNYHAVLVLDQPAASMTGYLNGAPIGSDTAGTLHSHGSDTGIGGMNNATRFHDGPVPGDGFYFDGVIDEVAFYNTALSGGTIAGHYAAGLSVPQDPGVAFQNPSNGAQVSGAISVVVTASDAQDPPSALIVEISTDGGASFTAATFNPGPDTHSLGWDTTVEPDGPETLVARVTDTDTNVVTSSIDVTVNNNPGGTAYRDTVLGDGPAVYWRLGETGGNTAADEMGAVDGTYVGGPSLGGPGLVGDADLAPIFGSGSYVAVPDSNLINIGQFTDRTVEAWFRTDDVNTRAVIFEEGAGTRGLSMYIDGGSVYVGGWNLSGTVWGPIFHSAPIVPGETYHVVVVLDSPSLTGYLNGVAMGTSGAAGTLFSHSANTGIAAMNDSARFHDGKVAGNGFEFDGVVDEVAVYNTALSGADAAAHYAAGDPAEPQDPTAAFFNPTDGSTVDGVVAIEVTASDPQDSPDLLSVEVSTDGGASYTPAVYDAGTGRHDLDWDTTSGGDGPYTLVARVTDTDTNESTTSIGVTVDNATAQFPTGSFFNPTDGATVDGVVSIEVTAADPQDTPDLLTVEISTDGGASYTAAAFDSGSGRHDLDWDTTVGGDGPYTLVARITDTDANEVSTSIDVTVDNATANFPDATFFNPSDGSTVAGVVAIEVTASDPQDSPDLLFVEVSTDGGGTFTPAVYDAGSGRHDLDWDTAVGSDGPYTLVARVTDTDNNESTTSIGVTVDNAAANRPTVSFIEPENGDTVLGLVTIEVTATDPQSTPDLLDVDISTDGGTTFSAAVYQPATQNHTFDWDTTAVGDGARTLVARVTDPDLNENTDSIGVTVLNTPTDAYRDAVVASNPDTYWRLDETSGSTAFDLMGNLNGTYVGGPAKGAAGLIVDDNTAVDFDGNNDHIAVPDSGLINIGNRSQKTISAWFRADSTSGRHVIVEEGGNTRGLNIYVYQGRVYLGAWNTPNDNSPDTPWGPHFFSTPISAGTVYNVVAVLDRAQGEFTAYVNGVAIGSGTSGALHGHGADTGIGGMNNAARFHNTTAGGNGHYFNGVIDEVAFYNRALPPEDIAHLYRIGVDQQTVSFDNPKDGNVVSGSFTIEVDAYDPEQHTSALTVEVSTDDGATFMPTSYNAATQLHELTWDTAALANGSRGLVARVTDGQANQSTESIDVTISNNGGTHLVVAAGDISHCNNTNDNNTAELITTILDTTSLPVTVVPLGDLISEVGAASEFTDCYEPTWGRHKAITMPVVGNHEYFTSGAGPYYDYWGSVAAPPHGYYRFELAGWELYSLNSNCGPIGGCGPTSTQIQWLRSELAASSNACTIGMTHHPRFFEAAPVSNLEEFWKALYDFDAELVLSGNEHFFAKSAAQDWQGNLDPVNGIIQLLAGTGGRSLHSLPSNPHANQEIQDNSTFGVIVLELGAGSYTWQFRRVGDGAITHTGTGTCH